MLLEPEPEPETRIAYLPAFSHAPSFARAGMPARQRAFFAHTGACASRARAVAPWSAPSAPPLRARFVRTHRHYSMCQVENSLPSDILVLLPSLSYRRLVFLGNLRCEGACPVVPMDNIRGSSRVMF